MHNEMNDVIRDLKASEMDEINLTATTDEVVEIVDFDPNEFTQPLTEL